MGVTLGVKVAVGGDVLVGMAVSVAVSVVVGVLVIAGLGVAVINGVGVSVGNAVGSDVDVLAWASVGIAGGSVESSLLQAEATSVRINITVMMNKRDIGYPLITRTK